MQTTRATMSIRLAAVAAGLVVTACGGGDTTATTSPTATTSATDSATEVGSADASAEAGPAIEVTAVDYAFEGVPETAAAGSRLTLTNSSPGEVHELVAFRIDDDETRPIDELLAESADDSEPDYITFKGVTIALPGEEGFEPEGPVVLDEPGRYGLVCFIPVGADPAAVAAAMEAGGSEAPDLGDGAPHFTEGMWAELVVE